ncbi:MULTISPECIES: YceI family protein [unclassified Colwellia]|jgi:polyisoprenoid-binding protein YceI|uniref:YceI family protein n=1 Tax=unclassified Colwellia TaxID=196834 RepID=UPI0015F63BD1|nr:MULTISPECIES: YceI family protein [unclassified Colwellia]MBA6364160.1 YceI family protein [Colwellia sp. BRX8-8]MBA6348865.1 YceI family protein [Colwellia sp. BRX8-9]MBA6355595.1 YceI family protein [Colwellia sp. BRX8-3]MBA6360484.1 YceI family protein [Colwellia sp. BRX8-6]MBA6367780.1 YceI family protein [Colwellia sp. BRX8-5]
MKKLLLASILPTLLMTSAFTPTVNAADYIVDYKGAHASVNFKIKHLGYSWLTGRFDKFSGSFSYDAADLSTAKIEMLVDTTSLNTNHGERDKHVRSDDFLDVDKFGSAKFVSTSITDNGQNKLAINGTLTLHGVSKAIIIDAIKIGEGKDPWGGYRVGFSGTTKIGLADFGIPDTLGPASSHVELELHIEGIKK